MDQINQNAGFASSKPEGKTERLSARHCAMLIYDLTQGMTEHEPSVPPAIPGLCRLILRSREAGVILSYALPHGIDLRSPPIMDTLPRVPTDLVFSHPQTGAFYQTGFESCLAQSGRNVLLIAGMAIDRGCNTTAREALQRGLRTIIVQDACFTRDIKASPVGQVSMEEIKRVHLASLYRIGVELWTMDEICLALA
jgi:hypothetical protein